MSLLLTAPDDAGAQTEWQIQEVYSNPDGSIQFVELYTTSDFQDLLATGGAQLVAQSGSTIRTFTFPSDLPWWAYGETADRTLLIASAGYQALPVHPTADYGPLDANGLFFDPNATLLVLSFALQGGSLIIDQVAFDPRAMSDCRESVNYPGPILQLNTPENFWGDTNFPLSCCTEDGDCPSDGVPCTLEQCDVATNTCSYLPIDAVCDDGAFCNGAELCDPALGCEAALPIDPDDGVDCTDDSCDEVGDVVVNAPDDQACDDGNSCTADSCDALTGCGNAPIGGCQVAVPALSEWGQALMTGLLLIAGAIRARPRKRTAS